MPPAIERGSAPAKNRNPFFLPLLDYHDDRPRDPFAGANLLRVEIDAVIAVGSAARQNESPESCFSPIELAEISALNAQPSTLNTDFAAVQFDPQLCQGLDDGNLGAEGFADFGGERQILVVEVRPGVEF